MAMSEWGTEEELIAFARDGEAILDLPGSRPQREDEDVASTMKGLRIPSNASVWEDVIGQAKSK
jgi:amidase